MVMGGSSCCSSSVCGVVDVMVVVIVVIGVEVDFTVVVVVVGSCVALCPHCHTQHYTARNNGSKIYP